MELIAQIALGVIIGGFTIALMVIGFFVWNSRKRNERLAVGFVGRQHLSDRMSCLRKRGLLAHRSPAEEQR